MEGRGKRIEIRTAMGGGDCGFPFQRGRDYVVYAYQHEGKFVATICSQTAAVERAEADLAYLRNLPRSGQSGYVFGSVGNGESARRFDPTLGTWVQDGFSGASVTLTGPGKSARMVTGGDGSFRFDSLTPGKYNIAVAKDGYSLQEGSATLEVHASGCAYARETLVVDRRIAGKLTGADGLPAANIQVDLYPTRPTEQNPVPVPAAQIKTASDGSYELRNIRSGQYYLGINLLSTPSEKMPYARIFYPGTEDPSRASIVIVQDAPGARTYNFPIPAPQKQHSVEGAVYWPDGRPAESVTIMLEDIRGPWMTFVVSATTDPKGHFEVIPFDGTVYRIHANVFDLATNEWASAEPMPLGPITDVSKPLQLILVRKGNSTAGLMGEGLDRWRAGLGF
jgi:5-hydroxyisourate hydrolase-like protein (transthyretin family)